MLGQKRKLLIQRLTVGTMLIAILGFGVMRWFRLEEAVPGNHKVSVTYDSDLHDQASRPKPVLIDPPAPNLRVKMISDKLSEADDSIEAGKYEQTAILLEQAVQTAMAEDADSTGQTGTALKQTAEEIARIELVVKNGKPIEASRRIQTIINKLRENKSGLDF